MGLPLQVARKACQSTGLLPLLVEKLRTAVADKLFEFAGERHNLTMTFGVAGYRKGETLESRIARADTALCHGSERGRNKVMSGSCKVLTLVG